MDIYKKMEGSSLCSDSWRTQLCCLYHVYLNREHMNWQTPTHARQTSIFEILFPIISKVLINLIFSWICFERDVDML